MTVHTPRSPLSYECDPLSHPYASFNGHSSWSAPSKPRLENGISQADSSEDAQAREAETALREKVHVNGNAWAGDEDGEPEADRSSLEAARMSGV